MAPLPLLLAQAVAYSMIAVRYLKFILTILYSNVARLKRPYKLTFVLTKQCNSRCLNCNIWQAPAKRELTLQEIDVIAARNSHLKWIDFTGGEVSLRSDFVDIVKAFHHHCRDLLFVHFPTNGLKPQVIESMAREIGQLKSVKLVITVSLDGPPTTHDRLRGIKGNFDLALETYLKLKRLASVQVYFGMTLFHSNVGQVDETVKAIKQNIPDFDGADFHFNLGHHSQHYYGNQRSQDIMSEHDFSHEITRLARKRSWRFDPLSIFEKVYLKKVLSYLEHGRTPIPCRSLETSVYLSEEGQLYPCSMWDQKLGPLASYDFSLEKALSDQKTQQVRHEIRQGQCAHCWTPCEAYPSLLGGLKHLIS